MIRFPVLLAVLALSLAPTAVAQIQNAPRTWTSATGQKIEATLQKVDEQTITLVRSDGKSFTLPLTRLSKADQEYAKSKLKTPSSEKPAPQADSRQPVTAERYERLMREIADPKLVGIDIVDDDVVDLSPFIRLDMADESSHFIWRSASKLPPVFVAEGIDEHQGEALVFKVVPKTPAETHNKAEFNGLIQTLQNAKFGNIKASPIQSLNEQQTQFQFYVSAITPSNEAKHFYTYLIYFEDRVFSFQSTAASDERATKIIQLAPTAQLLDQAAGNLSDEMREELKVVVEGFAKLVNDGTMEEVLQALMPKEQFQSVKSDPDAWKDISAGFEERLRPTLKQALADADYDKAVYDGETKTVTFPMRPPLRLRKEDDRWVLLN